MRYLTDHEIRSDFVAGGEDNGIHSDPAVTNLAGMTVVPSGVGVGSDVTNVDSLDYVECSGGLFVMGASGDWVAIAGAATAAIRPCIKVNNATAAQQTQIENRLKMSKEARMLQLQLTASPGTFQIGFYP